MRTLMTMALFASVFACALLRSARAEPTPLWSVDFDSVGTVPQWATVQHELASGGIGSGVFLSMPGGGISRFASIAKVDGYGSPVWLAEHRNQLSGSGIAPKMRVLSDGSVIVLADTVNRYSSYGELIWASPYYGSLGSDIVEVGGVLFVATRGGQQPAAVLDLASGRTLETLPSADLSFGEYLSLAAVGSDTVYAFVKQYKRISKIRLNPLRVEWSVSLKGLGSPLEASLRCCAGNSLVADESGAYVAGYSEVAKVSAVDGVLLWTQTTAADYALALAADVSNPADLLAIGSSRVTSLARSTGATRWSHVPPAAVSAFEAFDDAVIVVGNPDASATSANPGFIERLHRDDGTVLWQQPISASAGTTSSVRGVAVDADRIVASGVQCASDQAPEQCELVVWHTSVNGGALVMVKPVFAQSVEYAASAGDGVSTVAAALVATPIGQQILIRHIRDSDGVVLWESSMPASLPNAPGRAIQELNIFWTQSASRDVVVAFARQPDGVPRTQPLGGAVIAKFSGSDGTLQWRRSLLNSADGYTDTAANTYSVGTDTAGNVFAFVQELKPNLASGLYLTDRREVRKYSAATGDELLRVAFQPTHSATGLFLPVLARVQVIGDVLVTGQAPLPQSVSGVFGIDATTGSVLWIIGTPSYLNQPYPSEGSSAFSTYAQTTPSPLMRLSRFDATTGNVAWETPYSNPSDFSYSQPAMARGSDDGVYVATLSRTGPIGPNGFATTWPPVPRILRADDATGAITWINRFENDPVTPYSMPRPLFNHNDVHFALQRSYRAAVSYGPFLTALSQLDGVFQGTTALGFDNFGWPQLPATKIDIQGLAADGGMIIRRLGDLPGEPTRLSVRKVPLPQPFSGGSLRVGMDTSSVSVSAGQKMTSFRFDVVNNGNISADAVEAIVGLPTQSIIDSVSCTMAGSPCVAEATPRYIRTLADIGMGEHLVLTGTIRFSARETTNASIEASAYSTAGLVEMDMKDNMAIVYLPDVLFSSGFDR